MGLIQMSIAGGVMVIAVIILRALLIRILSKRTFLILWGIVLCRLLLPFELPSGLSIYNALGRRAPYETANSEMFNAMSQEILGPYGISGRAVPSVFNWKTVWGIGAAGCLAFFIITYIKSCREFRMSFPVNNAAVKRWSETHSIRRQIGIRQTDRIASPLSYGILHPVILLPKSAGWDDPKCLQFILEHEFVHIQRLDALFKLVLAGGLCIHWFNPLVWAMYILCNRDIELSCDETVVRRFGEDNRAAYAMALIGMEEKRSGFMPLGNSFSKNAMEERVGAVMKIRKVSLFSTALAVLVVAGTFSAFATSAVSEGNVQAGPGLEESGQNMENETAGRKGQEAQREAAGLAVEAVRDEAMALSAAFGKDGYSAAEYAEIKKALEADTQAGEGKKKIVRKNYVNEEGIPAAISYEEYIDGAWWGGFLERADASELRGSSLYQAEFTGTLYQKEI